MQRVNSKLFFRSPRRFFSTPAPVKIYGFPLSQPTRSVVLLCKEANIPFESIEVNALKGETRKPEFLKINPAGQVPVIEEAELGALGECGAILQYLAESRNLEKWYPTDPAVRARVNFWMHWHHSNSRLGTIGVLVPSVMYPPKDEAGFATFAANKKKFARSLNFLDIRLGYLGNQRFLGGTEHPTIADLLIIPELDQHLPEAMDTFDLTPYPHLNSYLARFKEAVPSYESVYEPVKKIAVKYKKK